VGILEIIVGLASQSVSLWADGVHSIATATVLLIVWIGLHLSGRSPDGTFHFGYYRFETLGSLFAAFLMTVFGGLVVLEAYMAWIEQTVLTNAELAIAVALSAASIGIIVSIMIQRASRIYGSTSLRVGALNGLLDVLSSFAVSLGVFMSFYLGIRHADTVAGLLIAFAIFSGAYSIFKEASLVLTDACRCGDIVSAIGDIAKKMKEIKEVHSIRMRQLGPYLVGDMHVVVDSEMLVRDADRISTELENKIKEEFGSVIELKVRIESDEAHSLHSKKLTVKSDTSSKV